MVARSPVANPMGLSAAMRRPGLVNGKPTDAERQRRRQNRLCIYCGEHGHSAIHCTKAGTRRSSLLALAAVAPGDTTPTDGAASKEGTPQVKA